MSYGSGWNPSTNTLISARAVEQWLWPKSLDCACYCQVGWKRHCAKCKTWDGEIDDATRLMFPSMVLIAAEASCVLTIWSNEFKRFLCSYWSNVGRASPFSEDRATCLVRCFDSLQYETWHSFYDKKYDAPYFLQQWRLFAQSPPLFIEVRHFLTVKRNRSVRYGN